MKIGSLFSGIGGLDLAVESVTGGRVAWHSEVDPYACAVLARRWPGVPNLGDITAICSPPHVEVIAGGFPCQDISLAGPGEGIDGARSGLWGDFCRVVREVGPALVCVENVAALRSRGLDRVLGDLASCGFDAEWSCLAASDVGAPHKRDRMFVLAYRDEDLIRKLAERQQRVASECEDGESVHARGDVADADQDGREELGPKDDQDHGDASWGDPHGRDQGVVYPPRPTDGEGWAAWASEGRPVPGVCRGAYGASRSLDARRRRGRVGCLGNGVAPRHAAAAFLGLLKRACGPP